MARIGVTGDQESVFSARPEINFEIHYIVEVERNCPFDRAQSSDWVCNQLRLLLCLDLSQPAVAIRNLPYQPADRPPGPPAPRGGSGRNRAMTGPTVTTIVPAAPE